MSSKPIIGITSSASYDPEEYSEAVAKAGGSPLMLPPDETRPTDEILNGIDGLMLPGGPDIDPAVYGDAPRPDANLEINRQLDDLELSLIKAALSRDLPVLGICRGMQALNVALGGKLIQDLSGHKGEEKNGRNESVRHRIYISPGSKLAAILGSGGFVQVNSRHHQGLREPQKSRALMASAYSLDDGLIEGLESPGHRWVIGVQCHPEIADEVPRQFQNLFLGLVEQAARGMSKKG